MIRKTEKYRWNWNDVKIFGV